MATYAVNEPAVAAEWRHKAVERAAYDLLQQLDDTAAEPQNL